MSGPCDPSLGWAVNANAVPSGAYAAFVSMTWSPWAISTVSAAARLGVGSAEDDGVSVGASEGGSSLPVTVAVAVAVGDAVAGGGLTDGLAVGGWLDPPPGASV